MRKIANFSVQILQSVQRRELIRNGANKLIVIENPAINTYWDYWNRLKQSCKYNFVSAVSNPICDGKVPLMRFELRALNAKTNITWLSDIRYIWFEHDWMWFDKHVSQIRQKTDRREQGARELTVVDISAMHQWIAININHSIATNTNLSQRGQRRQLARHRRQRAAQLFVINVTEPRTDAHTCESYASFWQHARTFESLWNWRRSLCCRCMAVCWRNEDKSHCCNLLKKKKKRKKGKRRMVCALAVCAGGWVHKTKRTDRIVKHHQRVILHRLKGLRNHNAHKQPKHHRSTTHRCSDQGWLSAAFSFFFFFAAMKYVDASDEEDDRVDSLLAQPQSFLLSRRSSFSAASSVSSRKEFVSIANQCCLFALLRSDM